jgi:hypothetical protein
MELRDPRSLIAQSQSAQVSRGQRNENMPGNSKWWKATWTDPIRWSKCLRDGP